MTEQDKSFVDKYVVKLPGLGPVPLPIYDEIVRLQEQNQRLRENECPKCGRALPPDGDCYGCVYDAAMERIRQLEQQLADATKQAAYWCEQAGGLKIQLEEATEALKRADSDMAELAADVTELADRLEECETREAYGQLKAERDKLEAEHLRCVEERENYFSQWQRSKAEAVELRQALEMALEAMGATCFGSDELLEACEHALNSATLADEHLKKDHEMILGKTIRLQEMEGERDKAIAEATDVRKEKDRAQFWYGEANKVLGEIKVILGGTDEDFPVDLARAIRLKADNAVAEAAEFMAGLEEALPWVDDSGQTVLTQRLATLLTSTTLAKEHLAKDQERDELLRFYAEPKHYLLVCDHDAMTGEETPLVSIVQQDSGVRARRALGE